ncbi:MAG: hypothetical protein KDC46_00350 [Thermoleophilia bacterium]|nr:hypothetical protein [Thermoleophilia bacterium]
MHSHMYFYAESARPDWSAPPPSDDAAKARVRAIADALLEAVPALREWRREDKDDDGTGVGMYLSPLDWIAVYGDHVHWDIMYRGDRELAEYDTMATLRTVAAVLEQVAGFDFFENGCQGLNERGDIEEMPAVLRGEHEARWLRDKGYID